MIRYCSQRDHRSCAPVAILNIMKHFGYGVTYDVVPILQLFLGTNDKGTNVPDIEDALKEFRAWEVQKFYPSLTNIRRHLKKNNVILITYAQRVRGSWTGHACVIVEENELGFKVLNDLKKTISYQSEKVLRPCTRARCLGRTRFPVAWAINEKKNRTSNRRSSNPPALQQRCVHRGLSNNRRTTSQVKNTRRRTKSA